MRRQNAVFVSSLTVKQPNNSGNVTYSYAANTVTVTDAAQNWKKYGTDALGNLVAATEQDPVEGQVLTTYEYNNPANKLTGVFMTRGGITQPRSFIYDLQQPSMRLYQETHPETGTTTYFYNQDGTLWYKTDAKGQKIEVVYDAYKRVTGVKKFRAGQTTEDVCQRVDYYWDGPAAHNQYPANIVGRVSAIVYGAVPTAGNGCPGPGQFEEIFS